MPARRRRGATQHQSGPWRSRPFLSPATLLASARRAAASLYVQDEQGRLVAENRGVRRLVRVLVRLAPWLMLLAGLLFNEFLPLMRYSPVPLFVGAPLIAAPFYSLPAVVVIALLAIGGILQRGIYYGDVGGSADVTQVLTTIMVGVLAVVINHVITRGDVMLTTARQIATAAQRAVLPEPIERLAGLDVAAHYEAATAGAFIGGDLYAVQDTPHGVRLIVGDVRGKGMEAVAAVAVLLGAFREAAEQEVSLEAVARRLDRALTREGARRRPLDDEEFATAVIGEIPHGHDMIRIVNRGHPWPLMVYGDGRVEHVATVEDALPLGMSALGTWPDHAQEIPFPLGATLLLYTDGLTEARDMHGVFYDPVADLQGRVFQEPEVLLTALMDEVRRHTGDRATDDLALLAVRSPPTL